MKLEALKPTSYTDESGMKHETYSYIKTDNNGSKSKKGSISCTVYFVLFRLMRKQGLQFYLKHKQILKRRSERPSSLYEQVH
jgi:hypothetical protein